MKIILTILIFINAPMNLGLAASPIDRTIEELFEESEVIVDAEVVAIDGKCIGNHCEVQYGLSISAKHKGSDINNELTVNSYSQLKLGKSYTLFMYKSNRYSEKPVHGLNREYSVWHDGAFYKAGRRAYRYGSPESTEIIEENGELYLVDSILFEDFDLALSKLGRPQSSK